MQWRALLIAVALPSAPAALAGFSLGWVSWFAFCGLAAFFIGVASLASVQE